MYKILFIDDEKSVIQYLPMAIDWDKFQITQMKDACNGKEGLEVMREFDPDIVIADMEMPVMNGITFCQEVRKINTKVKIIILSAFDKFDYVKNALKYDVNNYLLKPIDEEELEQTISEVIREIEEEKTHSTELELLKIQGIGKELQVIYDCYKEEKECRISLEEEYPFLLEYPDICIVRYAGKDREYEFYTALKKVLSEQKQCRCYPVYVNSIFTVVFGKCEEDFRFSEYVGQVDNELLEQGVKLVYTYSGKEKNSASEKILGGMKSSSIWFYDNENRKICIQSQSMKKAEFPLIDIRPCMEELENTSRTECLEKAVLKVVFEAVKDRAPIESLFNFILNTLISVKIYLAGYQEDSFMEVFRSINFESFLMCRNPKELTELVRASIQSLEEKAETFYGGNEGMYIVRQAKRYTSSHYKNSGMTLQEVADYVGISKNYFSKIFKEISGQKYWDYLTEYRIEKAKGLLRETNLSQCMICEQIGYQSEYHFSRKFKELTGVTPSKYRNYK